MRPCHDPISPEERLRQIASILAAGVRALRDRAALSANPGDISASDNFLESRPNCLESGGDSRLSVHTG
jgi:hypothetical protein